MSSDPRAPSLAEALPALHAHNREQDTEILRQHRRIEALERRLARLESRLTEASAGASDDPPDPPPPHY